MPASADKLPNRLPAASKPPSVSRWRRIRTAPCAWFVAFAMLLPALLLALSTAADAQGGGTSQERRACSGDVQLYCKKAIPGGDLSVLGCLRQNRSSISAACMRVLGDRGL